MMHGESDGIWHVNRRGEYESKKWREEWWHNEGFWSWWHRNSWVEYEFKSWGGNFDNGSNKVERVAEGRNEGWVVKPAAHSSPNIGQNSNIYSPF